MLTQLLFERAGLESSEADSAAITLTLCLGSAGNLKIHRQSLMLDGVCARDGAGPWQYDAAGLAALKLKTPWHDGARHLVMSPLKPMQRLAVLIPRHRQPILPVARGPYE